MASRVGTSNNGLYYWLKVYGADSKTIQSMRADQEEIRKPHKKVTQERDVLKEVARYIAQEPK